MPSVIINKKNIYIGTINWQLNSLNIGYVNLETFKYIRCKWNTENLKLK